MEYSTNLELDIAIWFGWHGPLTNNKIVFMHYSMNRKFESCYLHINSIVFVTRSYDFLLLCWYLNKFYIIGLFLLIISNNSKTNLVCSFS